MKVECSREKIKTAVASAERITGKNLSLPSLSSVVLESTDTGRFVLTATNLEMGVEIEVPARIVRQGKVAVVGSLLNNFLSCAGGDDVVVLEQVSGNLSAATGKHAALLKCMSHDEFPRIPRFAVEASFAIHTGLFRDGVRSVAYAASLSSIKPELASVFVHTRSGEIIFVATDSFRLAEKRVSVKGIPDGFSFMLPYRNALEATRVFDAVSGEINIGFDKNQAAFLSEGIYLTTRLTGGVFPDYAEIIPRGKQTEAVALKRDLLGALKLTSVFSDKFNRTTIRVYPKDARFELESRNTDRGENTTRIDATLEGEPVELAFNSRYILDAFQSILEDSISLSFSGPGKPLVMRGVGGPTFTYLVMPLNN